VTSWHGFNWGSANWSGFAWGGFKWAAGNWTGPVVTWAYFTLDHLNSVAVVTGQNGQVVQRLSYDPWGKQRNANGTDAACGAIIPDTTRGFTNQEQMPVGCLVNLNARIYDPSIGKFMAADPVVGDPYAPNAFNRYAYVLNNPLSFTDPSGQCFLGICTWARSPIFDAVLVIAIAVALPEAEVAIWGDGGAAFASSTIGAISNGIVAGGLSAGITGRNVLQGALLGGLQAGLFNVAGSFLSGEGEVVAENAEMSGGDMPDLEYASPTVSGSLTVDTFVAHGLIGGVTSVAQGGNFGSGFLAGGVSSFTITPSQPFSVGNLIVSTVAGGTASALGGGKFASGAVTGAFAYAAEASYANDNDQSQNGGPQANGSGEIVVAGTYMQLNGQIVTAYYNPYYSYDAVSQQSFVIHEGIHVGQLQTWYPQNWLGAIESTIDYLLNPQKFEIPAYQAQTDFLQNYLLNHVYTSPNWSQIFHTQTQVEDQLEKYQNMNH
jgi:RHS repeat-associated protein